MTAARTSSNATQPAMICSRIRRSRAFSCFCICATRALRSWLTCFLVTCDRPRVSGGWWSAAAVLPPDPMPRTPQDTVPTGSPLSRVWRSPREIALMAIVGIMRRGAGDPTFRRDPDGTLWRGIRTPDGPASLRLRARADLASVEATAWGAGAAWVLESVPSMLGADDDAEGFVAHHPQVALAARRFPGWRVPRT